MQQAVNVQRFLLPEPSVEGGGWHIEHLYRPVEHLGGDLLDVQRRLDGSWVVLIADVTGHGTTAALTAAMTKTAFVSTIGAARSPGQVLTEMNRKLLQVAPPGQFVTAQVIILNPHTGQAMIASAGHPFPMLARSTGAELIETNNGLPLTIQEQAKYHDIVLKDVSVGESILLYTDGAIEAVDGQRRQLGVEGLRAMVGSLGNAARPSLNDLLNAVLEHAQGRPADDIALLWIRRDAPAA